MKRNPFLALLTLLAICSPASASVVLFDNFGPAPGFNTANLFGVNEGSTGFFAFSPSTTDVLESVELPFRIANSVADPSLRFAFVEIFSSIGDGEQALPDAVLDTTIVTFPPPSISTTVREAPFSGGITLNASETYWVGIRTTPVEDMFGATLVWAASTQVGTSRGVIRKADGETSNLTLTHPLALRVNGIPEPSRALLCLLGLGAVLVRRRR